MSKSRPFSSSKTGPARTTHGSAPAFDLHADSIEIPVFHIEELQASQTATAHSLLPNSDPGLFLQESAASSLLTKGSDLAREAQIAEESSASAESGSVTQAETPAFIIEDPQPACEPTALSSANVVLNSAPRSLRPPAPQTLTECGVGQSCLADLLLKHLFISNETTLARLTYEMRLPLPVIDRLALTLESNGFVEVSRASAAALGEGPHKSAANGPARCAIRMSPAGRTHAREVFAASSYVGPAPVSLAEFIRWTRPFCVASERLIASEFREEFKDLVLSNEVLDKLGTAAWSGRHALLLAGSGDGKTTIANRLAEWLRSRGDEVLVPYAVWVEGEIVTVYDPAQHALADGAAGRTHRADPAVTVLKKGSDPFLQASFHGENQTSERVRPLFQQAVNVAETHDTRWLSVQPPLLKINSQDLADLWQMRAGRGYLVAPLAVQANGGLVIIDEPAGTNQWSNSAELLSVLESQQVRVSPRAGVSMRWPCTATVICCSAKLPTEACLRRIPHLVELPPPTRAAFAEILRRECARRGIAYSDELVSYIFSTPNSRAIPPRASDPGELLENVAALCRFSQVTPCLSSEVWERALELRGHPRRHSA